MNGSCCAAFFRRSSFYCLIEDRSGATAIEYGLIAVLVSVAAIAAFSLTGGSLNDIFDLVTNAVSDTPRAVLKSDPTATNDPPSCLAYSTSQPDPPPPVTTS
ncbi:MAG: Flp family type IVb pilin [Proteobacteria bacterium]|nr:Flp family type IVb pilin [Pseudomonadota bacterium]